MTRGVKKLSLHEQLEKLTKEIDAMEVSLADMKQTKKELEEQIKMARLTELDELITDSGISFEEVKALLCKE